MYMHEFWSVIETARSAATADKTFSEALVDELASRPQVDILSYQERFDEVHEAVYRWDMWAAAYLIGGGCSDDSFMDFRAGLIALGRDWFEKAAACPDSLAGHPAVIDAVRAQHGEAIFDEDANYAASCAFERLTGNDHAFYEAWDAYKPPNERRGQAGEDMGEDFDFDDPEEMRRRLPRLSALYLYDGAH
ncbi:DUF4240 domain-containing protein [Streptomyces sp. NRRL F-2664]|uniref:DUF4240 domain-containing protein n=1 Tax=Streptomyces sp. NRRL F-2664 TaxID=1463842 RepID=UPI0004C7253B|nr:DUF4240 domain-containing protein [Streptomyces sp. NRRL F-2664]